jgi:uncharacterized protein YndB with AHSA1/START domain
MATATTIPLITITRILNASRERVFAAWTQPEFMNQWFAPSSAFNVTAQTDLRTGGSFAIEMAWKSDGALHTAVGKYLEITPPEKIVMSWDWKEADPIDPAPGSTVTVELRDLGNKTELTLTHAMIQDATSRFGHQQGWTGSTNRLARIFDLQAEQLPIPDPRPIWQVE